MQPGETQASDARPGFCLTWSGFGPEGRCLGMFISYQCTLRLPPFRYGVHSFARSSFIYIFVMGSYYVTYSLLMGSRRIRICRLSVYYRIGLDRAPLYTFNRTIQDIDLVVLNIVTIIHRVCIYLPYIDTLDNIIVHVIRTFKAVNIVSPGDTLQRAHELLTERIHD